MLFQNNLAGRGGQETTWVVLFAFVYYSMYLLKPSTYAILNPDFVPARTVSQIFSYFAGLRMVLRFLLLRVHCAHTEFIRPFLCVVTSLDVQSR